ncbi:hypothetical protein CCR83_10180 [Rhodobacter veldkampii DSM 11550]|uniref:Tripartite tricarboxylate transporter substrate binding protein n=1 Tax=Phaeovulum veldkampii DSM 11550 TaxID=1185920 RepID=A0A2T4JM53_9RHOB|nr:hypothetical protein [Phaeovulum veldkampii]MBK5946789.1 hypothetical protein [Phaeovulum veldkampii DSM 11550]PTE18974.1 hypothetical protein C5F46_02120 [Phaeovulum veldkampii DSM 11550]TDQ64714.1 tripartite-type tricarboxylate transporter receptor subunit TctC [Phaeovulum veldkampii DSM 11550]
MKLPSCLRYTALAALAAVLSLEPVAADPSLPTDCASVFQGQRLTIVVPNAAGGGYDLYARALAPVLTAITGATAQVTNLPGGGGKTAIARVNEAPPSEMVALFDSATDVIPSVLSDATLGMTMADLEVLGIVHSDPETWLARHGIDLADPSTTRLISAASMIESNLIPVGLASLALGIESKVIAGYNGSVENTAAILRGEVDMASASLTTALRARETNDLDLALVLADSPHPAAPDVPVLGGPGGMIERRSAGLPAPERAERQRLGEIVVALANGPRTLFAPARMEPRTKACFEAAMTAALESPDFRAAAEARKRPVTPVTGPEADEIVARIATAYLDARPLLEMLLASQSR